MGQFFKGLLRFLPLILLSVLVTAALPLAFNPGAALAQSGGTTTQSTVPDPSLPQLSEGFVKNIASSAAGVSRILDEHDELERHATYDRDKGIWTVFWTLPGSVRRLITVEVSDPGGVIIFSRIEPEAYMDIIPAISEQEAIDIARGQPRIIEELDGREADPRASYGSDMIWTVSFYEGTDELAQVTVDDDTGLVDEVMVGPQVAWQMARGYKGAFGRIINEPYVWLPLCALFLLPFVNIRRIFCMVHLDLLVLLSFTVSHYFFNKGEIDVSVPLAYPPLIYLFLRMCWIGLTRRRRRAGQAICAANKEVGGDEESGAFMPHLNFRPSIILAGIIILVIFRLVINIADSNVVDVGYSGVIGAHRILEGQTPYGNMPSDNSNGDTYAPFNYLLYVPFEASLNWSGEWDDLPAAHAAAIFFDLLSAGGMFMAGRMLMRGRAAGNQLGLGLAFAWLAYPYSTFVLQCNVNDTIVAAFLVWGFVLMRWAPIAGVMLGLATQIKFFPIILAPLWASFPRAFSGWGRRGIFITGFALAIALAAPVIFLGDGNFQVFWERSIKWQIERDSPFSIWGQHAALAEIQRLGQYVLLAVAALLYLLPPRKNLMQLAALTGALVLGFQLLQTHWFYLYIPWFAPMALIAVLAGNRQKVS